MLKLTLRFIHNKIAASGPLPIERALKSDVLSILVAYQQLYSNNENANINTSDFFPLETEIAHLLESNS